MNKQIEKIARVIKSSLDGLGCGNFNFTGDEISTMFATELYNAGYRKQSEGEWVHGENGMAHCSECGNEEPSHSISTYCPECGAKMEGGETDA